MTHTDCSLFALGTRRPLTETLADYLICEGENANGICDLSFLTLVAPTAEAGRLLRETLARRGMDAGGLLPPRVILPGGLTATEHADDSEIGRAWIEALREANEQDCADLIPRLNEFKSDPAALLELGDRLQQCRMELAEGGTSLDEAAAKLDELSRTRGGAALEHSFRFRAFAALEKLYLRQLGSAERDPAFAMRRAAEKPNLGENCRKLIVAACPDAPPLFFQAATRLAENGFPVVIGVHADSTETFDSFGRPLVEAWRKRTIPFDPERCLRRFDSVAEEAEAILNQLSGNYRPSVVGVVGDELRDAILDRARGKTFNAPLRQPLRASGPGAFFALLLNLDAENPAYEAAAAVLRHAFFLSFAVRRGMLSDAEKALTELDKIQNESLAQNCAALKKNLLRHAAKDTATAKELLNELELLTEFAQRLHASEQPLTECYNFLAELCGEPGTGFARTPENLEQLDLLGDCIVEAEKASGSDRAMALALFREKFRDAFVPQETQEPSAVDLAGFLELEWRSDSCLLIGGMNAENFNYGVASGAFLPEQARTLLGLPGEAERYAADVCRFAAIVGERRETGSLTLFCSATTTSGETLKPARLFFQCADAELPRRVGLIFGGELDAQSTRPPRPNFGADAFFHIRNAAPSPRMSITAFKSYLSCPFRYYLNNVLACETLDDRAPEFDNLQFGTLTHKVLEECVRDCAASDAPGIERFALAALEKQKQLRFGHFPAALAELQFELLKHSLHYFAQRQSEMLSEGWTPIAVERKTSVVWNTLFECFFPAEPHEDWRDGIVLVGKIDRIDRNRADNRVRIIDYKTNRTFLSPEKTHWSTSGEEAADAFRAAPPSDHGKPRYWTDLQLPLYCALMANGLLLDGESAPAEAAYFNLPLAFAQTGLSPFHALDSRDTLESAIRCADAVLRRIYVDSVFWPPRRPADPRYDDWGDVFGILNAENFTLPQNWKERS